MRAPVSTPFVIALLLSLTGACSRDKPETKAPTPEPAAAVVEAPAPEPAAATASVASAVEDDSIKAALLGLNRKDEVAEAPAEPAPSRRRARRARRRVEPDADPIPEAKPALSDYEFQSAVNKWRGMRRCLARSSLRGTERRGAMKVNFKIRGDGSVSDCEVVETSNAVAATIAPCVEQAARRIRFPAFGGEEVEKAAKFVF